jgi:hypothetical protein
MRVLKHAYETVKKYGFSTVSYEIITKSDALKVTLGDKIVYS